MLTVNICNEGRKESIFFCIIFVVQMFCYKHAFLLQSDFCLCVSVCARFLKDLISVNLFTYKGSLPKKQILNPKE